MIRALFILPRLRRARQEALQALMNAEKRRDTRALHHAHTQARTSLHHLMSVEQGR